MLRSETQFGSVAVEGRATQGTSLFGSVSSFTEATSSYSAACGRLAGFLGSSAQTT